MAFDETLSSLIAKDLLNYFWSFNHVGRCREGAFQ